MVSSFGMETIAGDFFLEKLAIMVAHIVRITVAQKGMPRIFPDSFSKKLFTPSCASHVKYSPAGRYCIQRQRAVSLIP